MIFENNLATLCSSNLIVFGDAELEIETKTSFIKSKEEKNEK